MSNGNTRRSRGVCVSPLLRCTISDPREDLTSGAGQAQMSRFRVEVSGNVVVVMPFVIQSQTNTKLTYLAEHSMEAMRPA